MSAFDENPFADPSVQQATTGTGRVADLEDYDPFNKQNQKTMGGGGGTGGVTPAAPPTQPAVMSPTSQDAPPQYTPTGQQTVTTADFQRRQEELERKAAELARREEELKNSPYNARVNNWPPLPSFMPCQPCFYQDINVDIPVEFQEMVKRLYYLWLLHTALMVANVLGGMCLLFSGGEDHGTVFGLAILYGAVGIPASFLCWFRPAYKAFRSDSSFNFMVFFFIFFLQFLFSAIMALGIPSSGGCGLITAIATFRAKEATGGDVFVGILLLIIGIGFTVAAVADFFMLNKIHGLYRATGASLAKAQAEFTTNVLSNEGVRNAAANAAASAAQQGVRSQFGGQQQQAPRY